MLYLDPSDARPPTMLRFEVPSAAVMIGGLVALALHGLALLVAIGIALALHAATEALLAAQAQDAPALLEEDVIEARFVTLGRELDPNEMPNRIVPRLSTAPPEPSTTPTRDTPTERAEPQERPEERPPDAVDDALARLGDRAQAFAEIAEEREREGHPEGIEGGTETEATEGNLYAGRVSDFFRRGWTIPTTLTRDEVTALRCTATVRIGADLQIVSFEIRNSSGNALFDQSVLEQLTRLQASDQRLPPPPEEEAARYIDNTVPIRFNGREAR